MSLLLDQPIGLVVCIAVPLLLSERLPLGCHRLPRHWRFSVLFASLSLLQSPTNSFGEINLVSAGIMDID